MDTHLQQLVRQWRSDPSPEVAEKIAAAVSRSSSSDDGDDVPKYVLTLTERQAQNILDAADLYSRIQCGQLNTILDTFRFRNDLPFEGSLAQAEHFLQGAKQALFDLPVNASHSIRSDAVPEFAKIAYDIHQVVRHRVAWDRTHAAGEENPSMGGVWHYTPWVTAEHPLPRIEGQTACHCKNDDCPK